MLKINEFPELATLADNDLLLIWDTSANITAKVQLSTLKAFLGTTGGTTGNTPTTTKELTYASNGDTNGLAYFIGTQEGTVAWQNPHNNGLSMSASDIAAGTIDSLVDRQPSEFYTSSIDNSWVELIISSGSLKCNYYSIRNRSNVDHYLRNWKFQGSNDGSVWADLDVRTNNITLSSPSQWLSFPITTTNFYTQFRLLQNGLNSAGYAYLCLGEIELYGTYTY
ncbi:hypothetical protein H6G81_34410 [Scytonema hofmannii FACHB-248]|uniref:F5/8 type C domain-containing protein n=1 Tax=Scytonema hofmannii FACHB-248 TaxID=1842502 RepID=A0ABR8H1Q5_9CYAN|nr:MULTISPECIES: hypothetical protein [Nostocales]MBD2609449.1 hypothetical protein [Scytonema hofmannii FACHB-248]